MNQPLFRNVNSRSSQRATERTSSSLAVFFNSAENLEIQLKKLQRTLLWQVAMKLHRIKCQMRQVPCGDPIDFISEQIRLAFAQYRSGHNSVHTYLHAEAIVFEKFRSIIPKFTFGKLHFDSDFWKHNLLKLFGFRQFLLARDRVIEFHQKSLRLREHADGGECYGSGRFDELWADQASAWPRNPSLVSQNSASEVDVIVPVYKGLEETLKCLYSVLSASVKTKFRLVVYNDCSPEPDLSDKLRELAQADLIELTENTVNMGFVGTVNRAMMASSKNVVLLNSDTEVFDHWLDNLKHAASFPDVASVTPLSNNATIWSYPEMNLANPPFLNVTPDEVATAFHAQNSRVHLKVPVGMGFCLWINRQCLNAIGYFDEGLFGKGYGEECEWCMRAFKAGWVNISALDTYVLHVGGVSFSGETSERKLLAEKVLLSQHQDYYEHVGDWINRDPFGPFRRRVDAWRLKKTIGGKPAILQVNHALGGGTRKHVDDLCSLLTKEGISNIIAMPLERDATILTLSDSSGDTYPNLKYSLISEREQLEEDLRFFGVQVVHYHHIIGYHRKVRELASWLTLPYVVTLHDFYLACPQINLFDYRSKFCGEPSEQDCNLCVQRKAPPQFPEHWISDWRKSNKNFLLNAARVVAPNLEVARLFSKLIPGVDIKIVPHPEQPVAELLHQSANVSIQKLKTDKTDKKEPRLRVITLGRLSMQKGSTVIYYCAKDAHERKLPIDFYLIGFSDVDDGLRNYPNVTITGAYHESQLPELISKARNFTGDVVCMIPSICPETYSFTLSSCITSGLYPVVFDLGAPAARIKELGWGCVLPLGLHAAALNSKLLDLQKNTDMAPPSLNKRAAAINQFPGVLAYYKGIGVIESLLCLDQSLGEELGSRTANSSATEHSSGTFLNSSPVAGSACHPIDMVSIDLN